MSEPRGKRRERRHAYIAGPYRASSSWWVEKNIRRAEEASFCVAELGMVPVCPHTMYRFFDGTLDDGFWLEVTLSQLRRCDVLVLVPGWEKSVGAQEEYDEAVRLGMDVVVHDGASGGFMDVVSWVKLYGPYLSPSIVEV